MSYFSTKILTPDEADQVSYSGRPPTTYHSPLLGLLKLAGGKGKGAGRRTNNIIPGERQK